MDSTHSTPLPVFQAMATGQPSEALLQMDPQHCKTLYNVAHLRFTAGEYEEALIVFHYLCWLNHLNADYFLGLGATQQQLKHYEKAINTLKYAAKLGPDEARPYFLMAQCHAALNHSDVAQQEFKTALDLAQKTGALALAAQIKPWIQQ